MPLRSGSSYGGGLAFKRSTSKRLPIISLWGPHPVKEMEKREGFVLSLIQKEARWFLGESRRRAEIELRKAKAKYGV